MPFFSSLVFPVLENTLSIVIVHRVKTRQWPLWVSLVLPRGFIVCLGVGLLVVATTAVLLLGAQFIAECERLGHTPDAAARPLDLRVKR